MIDKFMDWYFRWYTSKSVQQQIRIDTVKVVCNTVLFFIIGYYFVCFFCWFVCNYSDLFAKALYVVAFCGLVIQVVSFLHYLKQRRKK